ncbi:peptidoglycan DD-metalloendopeptidase family protein [Thermaurantiacus sp.]
MRLVPVLGLMLLAGCAGRNAALAPPPPPSRIEVEKPRWQPVPAVADGKPVPGGREHVVKAGETGLAIAAAYKVPWRSIAAANGIGFDSVIRVGQKLFVPTEATARAAATTPPADRARGSPPKGAQPKRPAPPDPQALAQSFQMNIDDLVSGSAVATSAPPPAIAGPARPQPALPQVPPLAWPVDGRVILSGFGPKPGGKVNEGVVIKAVAGSPVRAAAPGTVLYVGDAIESFGLLVLVRHAEGVITAYGHLSDALVARGQPVDQGAIIGRAGKTGAIAEPALMFQLRLGRKAVDPLPYLRRQA